RHRSDCGMHPQWRCLGSRIEYRLAWPRVDSARGGLGCVVHGGTYQFLAKRRENLPAEVRVRPDTGSPVRSRPMISRLRRVTSSNPKAAISFAFMLSSMVHTTETIQDESD